MRWLVLLAGSAALSGLATGVVRRYALERRLLDHPNERSSHERPTPRGGGLALAGVVLGGVALAGMLGWVPAAVSVAVTGGGLVVAGIGLVDDHRPQPVGLRAALHLLAAVWAVAWLGGLPDLRIGLHSVHLGWSGSVVAVLGIAWAINLYNFMDGIDGLAAGQAVVAAGLGGAFLLAEGPDGLALVALLACGASLGFLPWNWPPARIFMGDVGSGLLGFVFGSLALASERAGSLPLIGWILLLGTFVFDASVTLARRMLSGARWYEAHRTHGYQRAVQSGWSHRRVTGVLLILATVLGGLAWLAWRRPAWSLAAMMLAVVLLGAGYLALERRRPMAPRPEPM